VAFETGPEAEQSVNPEGPAAVVLDKGYHSSDVLVVLKEVGVRSYCSEPARGRRKWAEKGEEQQAVYQNRRRVRGERGKQLLRQRGERVERSFAHFYETGRMRRTHLRRHENIIKRLLIHASAFNLGLIMRKACGYGTPRGFGDAAGTCVLALRILCGLLRCLEFVESRNSQQIIGNGRAHGNALSIS
jgi:transposase